MNRKIRLIILIVYFFSLLFSLAQAQEQSGEAISMESGNTQGSNVSLDTYEDKLKYWQSLSEEQRQAIRERVKNIPPEKMQALRERLDKFRKLSPEEAERIKTNYKRFKQMDQDKRRDLQQRFNRFQSLPEERKIELRRKFMQRIKSGNKEEIFKDKDFQGIRDGKAEVLDLQRDKKQNRQAIRKRILENRKRIINRRRRLRQ